MATASSLLHASQGAISMDPACAKVCATRHGNCVPLVTTGAPIRQGHEGPCRYGLRPPKPPVAAAASWHRSQDRLHWVGPSTPLGRHR